MGQRRNGETKMPPVQYLDKCDTLGLTASTEVKLTISSLGAVICYLSKSFLEQLQLPR